MRIASAHIVNFRCIRELAVDFEDVTVLVGANGAGKSSILHALSWFFNGGTLTVDDVNGQRPGETVTVGVTFTDFDDADREALGSYVLDTEATFWRTWSDDGGDKLTGRGRAYPDFAEIRAEAKARPKTAAYNALRERKPDLGLPAVRSAQAVDEALSDWEADHQDQLTEARIDATHLFGFVGKAKLARRMDFVLVPAVSDPNVETQDARGTLLRQLLDRALGEQDGMRDRLADLEQTVGVELHKIMVDEGGAALDKLSADMTQQLSQLVSGAEVLLGARTPSVKVPALTVDLRVADDGLETAVGRQGHGFQRALLIAVVQELAAQGRRASASDEPDDEEGQAEASATTPPALFLALEEPELYQHPVQARHFAATLAALTAQSGAPVQVAYATHSEHFVDPAHYQRLRRCRRIQGAPWPQSEVARATIERVAKRLNGVFAPDQVALRVKMTLRRQVAEAFFAKAVLLVEGDSDVGLLRGIADRRAGLDALGVAVVQGRGKRQLLIPWAILTELGVPTHFVFDADAGVRDRMLANGKGQDEAEREHSRMAQENLLIMRTLGITTENPWPTSTVDENYTVFADRLEDECATWDGFVEAVEQARQDEGDWRSKSDDAYRQAAQTVPTTPPAPLQGIIDAAASLAG
jgi:putative ATP-dependent endonuclease of OLD family